MTLKLCPNLNKRDILTFRKAVDQRGSKPSCGECAAENAENTKII